MKVKCDEFKIDLINNFESTTNKWKKIITIVANNEHWEYLQNGPRSTRISVVQCMGISNKSMIIWQEQDAMKYIGIWYHKFRFT
jgi:hypothetical protein